jgi:transcriptional regulator with XRE-family HTH domain
LSRIGSAGDAGPSGRRRLADGQRLRLWVTPKVTQADLARQAGVSRQFVAKVVNGQRRPSPKIVQAAEELGLPIEAIFK